MKKIDFRRLHSFPKFFVDFATGESNSRSLFPDNAISGAVGLEKLRNRDFERDKLCDAITLSSKEKKFTANQHRNFDELKNERGLAVLTGQQAGFLGGPLYAALKALSAVSLAKKMNRRNPRFRFVPIFWIEDNDSDAAEASQIAIIDAMGDVRRFFCRSEQSPNRKIPVGELTFDNSIENTISEILAALPKTGRSAEIAELLRKIYRPGAKWSDAFLQFTNEILGESGILFVKASVLRERGMFRKIAEKELSTSGESKKIVERENRALAAMSYKIQAKVSEVNLFFHDNGERVNIEKTCDRKFRIGDTEYKKKEALNLCAKSPELFSPKVLLRPIVQDSIFPTAAYVAGPSELAYLAQIGGLYDFFNIPQPAIVPRHSATLIDGKTARRAEKLGLPFEKFFAQKEELAAEFASDRGGSDIESLFTAAGYRLRGIFADIDNEISKIDFSLSQSSRAALAKIENSVEALRRKTYSALKRADSETYRSLEACSNFIYPAGNMQERLISPLNFVLHTGVEDFAKIFEEALESEPDGHFFIKTF